MLINPINANAAGHSIASVKMASGEERDDVRIDVLSGPCHWRGCEECDYPHKHPFVKPSGMGPDGWQVRLEWPMFDDKRLAVVVEGAHKAEAIASAGYIGAAYTGGSSNSDKADYRPLAGMDVVVWPDNDESGRVAAL